MCIRDRNLRKAQAIQEQVMAIDPSNAVTVRNLAFVLERICLLYTSDAADERSSVDLGGRRIIKKKTNTVSINQIRSTKKNIIEA